jgi:hypothetical protein
MRRTGIACALDLPATLPPLDADRSTDLFRILQEALTNVVRHAAAGHVDVQVRVTPAELVLLVNDDGRGIEEVEASSPRSLGLLGMRERAAVERRRQVRARPERVPSSPCSCRSPKARHCVTDAIRVAIADDHPLVRAGLRQTIADDVALTVVVRRRRR